MPHAVLNLGFQSATVDIAASVRPLIPGIEPGGSRVGHPMKPALLIRDVWLQPIDVNVSAATGGNTMGYFLKLSQEESLNPGLLLPIGVFGNEHTQVSAVGAVNQPLEPQGMFKAQGSIWAPAFIGVRVEEVGNANVDCDVHIDYERVDVPWMDWFLMWDFLDNIVDNERQY